TPMIKQCPICKRIYEDETLSFCLEDGTMLLAVVPPTPQNNAPDSQTNPPPPTEIINHAPAVGEKPVGLPLFAKIIGGFAILSIVLFLVIVFFPSFGKRSTPEKATRAYIEALRDKNIQDYKDVQSESTLQMYEAAAKQENKTLDQELKEMFEGST